MPTAPAATDAPANTPTPVASPSATPSPTATPSAPTEAAVVDDSYVWTIDKPLVLKGVAGTAKWTHVLFAARTVSLRWKATPADADGCSFAYAVESKSLPKTAKGSAKTTSAKAATGRRNLTVKYGDGVVTVKSDCSKWSLTIVPTGHPGVVIKRSVEKTKVTGTTMVALNEALAASQTDWWLRSNSTYTSGGRIRVVRFRVTVDITYELPSWTPPDSTHPELVAAWKVALAGMKRHTQGEAAIAVQTAGRYLAAVTKRSFSSLRKWNDYLDKKSDTWLDWARDRQETYDADTLYGVAQGGMVQ